ncbi:MAG: CTP synthase (glutamine hydrolyzing) [Patescibacteria group bacterium]|nr:CTP synthase (glutamine hydrolyzing) [Patescibacteria group bacterium]
MPKKYIFISGGVISGIGKGITSASIALILKSAGFRVSPIKFEGYLNIDAGTINPIEHGDPFLCEDGTESDMDIGTYEKFLDQEMGKENFVTMGQIYQKIIEKERRFEYNGEDVEAVHITEEIINRIHHVAEKNDAEIVIIELGGTAGEYWNVFYYEAARLLAFRHPGDVIHIHVSYVPTPHHLGEPKTKPTQLSVRTLNSLGIQPDIVVARTDRRLDDRRKERLATFCNVHPADIISNPDVETPYEIPLILHDQGIEKRILAKLGLPDRKPDLSAWEKFIASVKAPKEKTIEIAIIGKYFGTGDYQLRDSYAALFDAIDHACWKANVGLKTVWVDAERVEKEGTGIIGQPDGIIVPIGWGERGAEGMIAAATYAREKKIPYLGLCYGMQLAAVAFARSVLGYSDANTTENNPKTKHPVIHLIESQKELMERRAYGGTMRLGGWVAAVRTGTRAWKLYNAANAFIDKEKNLTSERHRHRYEFNNEYADEFEKNGFIISARSPVENLCEIIELREDLHPFYLGTQGHPEYKSRPLAPNPIFIGFIDACKSQR